MATLSFPSVPDDLLNFPPGAEIDEYFMIDGALATSESQITAQSTSEVRYHGEDVLRVVDLTIEGTFTFGGRGAVKGTVVSVTVSLEGTPFLTITDAALDAARVWTSMLSDDGGLPALLTGNDTITGTHQNNDLRGNAGDDVIYGLGGTDAIRGGSGNDRIFGGRSGGQRQ